MKRSLAILLACTPVAFAQSAKPLARTEATSHLNFTEATDGSRTIAIRNVTYEIATNVPGWPPAQLLLLRKTVQSKEVLGDIGVDATVALEAWKLGDDPRQKPLYTVHAAGTEGHTLDNAIFVVSRGLEEVDWWSVYKLGSGQHLFDTYVPVVSFSISRDTVATRYAGLEVPPDDIQDARLKRPNVIAVLTYASGERVIREALLTANDAKQAALLRSFADESRTLSIEERPAARLLKIRFSDNYPSAPNPRDVLIPIKGDDLDLAGANLPPGVHVAVWNR